MSRPIVNPDSALLRLARISLLIYPLIAHIAILLDQPAWATGYLLVAVYFNSLKFFSADKITGMILFTAACVIIGYAFFISDIDNWTIYLPPALIPAWLAFIFISSLFSGKAFISQIAERMEGRPLDQQQLNYTRTLTIIWSGVFIAMIFEAIILSVFMPFDIWSWWVHVGNYIIIGFLFFGEILFRPLFTGKRAQFTQMLSLIFQRNWYGKRDE